MTTVTVAAREPDTGPTRALTGLGAVQPHVKEAAELIAAQAGITKVGGWRSTSAYDMGGHPAGLAVDFPCTRAQGDVVASYATANADALAVKYVIWRQQIWYPGKKWAAMSDRGSDSANHMDHVHISFKATGAGGSALDTLRKAIGNLPVVGDVLGAASQATSYLNPATWGREAQKIGLKLLVVAAGLGLLIVGGVRTVSDTALARYDDLKEAL